MTVSARRQSSPSWLVGPALSPNAESVSALLAEQFWCWSHDMEAGHSALRYYGFTPTSDGAHRLVDPLMITRTGASTPRVRRSAAARAVVIARARSLGLAAAGLALVLCERSNPRPPA